MTGDHHERSQLGHRDRVLDRCNGFSTHRNEYSARYEHCLSLLFQLCGIGDLHLTLGHEAQSTCPCARIAALYAKPVMGNMCIHAISSIRSDCEKASVARTLGSEGEGE